MSDKQEITIADMQRALEEMREAKNVYAEASKVSNDAHSLMKEKEYALIHMMEETNQDIFVVKGVGRVALKKTMSITTPKSPDDRRKFFDWLRKEKGDEIADSYMSVNSQSLNTLYNDLTQEFAERGEILMVDGLDEPITRVTLSLTKA